jgi:hypothetical protein
VLSADQAAQSLARAAGGPLLLPPAAGAGGASAASAAPGSLAEWERSLAAPSNGRGRRTPAPQPGGGLGAAAAAATKSGPGRQTARRPAPHRRPGDGLCVGRAAERGQGWPALPPGRRSSSDSSQKPFGALAERLQEPSASGGRVWRQRADTKLLFEVKRCGG